jgi:hypothetical protein
MFTIAGIVSQIKNNTPTPSTLDPSTLRVWYRENYVERTGKIQQWTNKATTSPLYHLLSSASSQDVSYISEAQGISLVGESNRWLIANEACLPSTSDFSLILVLKVAADLLTGTNLAGTNNTILSQYNNVTNSGAGRLILFLRKVLSGFQLIFFAGSSANNSTYPNYTYSSKIYNSSDFLIFCLKRQGETWSISLNNQLIVQDTLGYSKAIQQVPFALFTYLVSGVAGNFGTGIKLTEALITQNILETPQIINYLSSRYSINIIDSVSQVSYLSHTLSKTPFFYYRLNEESGTSISDSSGNNLTATLQSTTNVYNSSFWKLNEVSNRCLNIMANDTVDPHERIAISQRLATTSSFSVEIWWKKHFCYTNDTMMGANLVSPNYQWEFSFTTSGTTTRTFQLNFYNTRLDSFTWRLGYINHTVLTFTGSTCLVYNNGVLQTTINNAVISTFITEVTTNRLTNTWYLGQGIVSSVLGFFKCSDLAVYPSVLTATEINDRYYLAKRWTPQETTLTVWYKNEINATFRSGKCSNLFNLAGNQDNTNNAYSPGTSTDVFYGYDSLDMYVKGLSGAYLRTTSALVPSSSNFYIALVLQVEASTLSSDNYVFNQVLNNGPGRIRIFCSYVSSGIYKLNFVVGSSSTSSSSFGTFLLSTDNLSHSNTCCVLVERLETIWNFYYNGQIVGTFKDTAGVRTITQTAAIFLANDESTSGTFNILTRFCTDIRLREFILGTDMSAVPNIHRYLSKEYSLGF